jgi:ABC-2 type transport system ATP-binding protein
MNDTSLRPDVVAAFDRVTVRYGRTVAADAVSLEVPRGSVSALLGRNGAGKSSLVRCLLGQQKPTAGTASLFGRDAWCNRVAAMQRVGVVPEEPDVPPDMTADGVASFCARLYPRWDYKGLTARLDRFGVPRSVPAGRLSKGQKGQLALALALGHSPELLVLDDPTLGLDVVARKEFWEELVADLADRGTTVLLTTHDLAGVEHIAARVGILHRGRLVLHEDVESLRARFRVIRFGGCRESAPVAALAGLGVLKTVTSELGLEAVVSRWNEAGERALATSPGVVDPEVRAMSLEEIFVAVAENGMGGGQ